MTYKWDISGIKLDTRNWSAQCAGDYFEYFSGKMVLKRNVWLPLVRFYMSGNSTNWQIRETYIIQMSMGYWSMQCASDYFGVQWRTSAQEKLMKF
jgi:hypothetical protein